MRMIDADALIKEIKMDIEDDGLQEKMVFYRINEAPSIDIVRCKECKYYVNGQCWKSDGLDKLDGNVADDDFCSRGERDGE